MKKANFLPFFVMAAKQLNANLPITRVLHRLSVLEGVGPPIGGDPLCFKVEGASLCGGCGGV